MQDWIKEIENCTLENLPAIFFAIGSDRSLIGEPFEVLRDKIFERYNALK